MFGLSCLDRARASTDTLLLSEGFYLTLVAILLIALVSAALVAPLVQRGYRKRVVRLMRFNQVAPRPSQWWSSKAARASEAADLANSGESTANLPNLLSQRELRIAIATSLAWLVFALAAVPIAHWMLASSSASDRGYFVVLAALLALGPALVNMPRRFARWALVIGLVACALTAMLVDQFATSAAAAAAPASGPDDFDAGDWAILIALLALAYVSIFHRRLRGLVLPVFVVGAIALALFVIPLATLEPYLGNCLVETSEPGKHALQSAPFLLAVNTLIVLAGWLGFKGLDGLACLVDKGWLSELSLISVVSLALVAMMLIAGNLAEMAAPPKSLAWLWVPWVGVAVATYALALGRWAVTRPGPRLLVLRVFAHQRKQLKLLDQLQSRWRYIGPVHQIGGPDLATTNVDPHECALFLVGRLHDVFVPAAASPEQLSHRLLARADREGRYSISEVFCFNSAWQATVEQLMSISEVILLDLRGLTPQRQGTSYELRVLARTGLLDRVVAIGDALTDWDLVDSLLIAEGQTPQRLGQRIVGAELRADVIFDRLLRVAAGAGNTPPRAA